MKSMNKLYLKRFQYNFSNLLSDFEKFWRNWHWIILFFDYSSFGISTSGSVFRLAILFWTVIIIKSSSGVTKISSFFPMSLKYINSSLGSKSVTVFLALSHNWEINTEYWKMNFRNNYLLKFKVHIGRQTEQYHAKSIKVERQGNRQF